jgi:AcrR family transcriptional regulator
VSGGATAAGASVERLPPGRHKLSRAEVRESQLGRLQDAAAEALLGAGYGGITTTLVARAAGVSTATLYRYFDDLWACLLAAHEAGTERLCGEIEAGCATAEGDASARAAAGVEAALALLDREPALAYLLSAEPPGSAADLWAARRRLVSRLAAILGGGGPQARDEHLVVAALRMVARRARSGEPGAIRELGASLAAILLPHPASAVL